MNLALSEHLPLIAGGPDGIQKLRVLILELAVRGKLVPQDPADEPASELLKRIAKERTQLEAEGVCNRSKPLSQVGNDEQPFALPRNWAWVRLPEVYFSISPSSNKLLSSAIQETGAVPVVDQGKRYIAGYTDQVSMLINIPGPVVIFGDHTTERKYVDFDFVAGADGVKILRPILQYEKFFFRQLQGFKLEERGYARHFKVLNDQLYALPPLAEQHRIVAKVDELMVLCDRLESEQNDSDAAHTQLVETLLGTLTQSTDATDFEANWKRIAEHFDTLFTTESSIGALKQTILQLAVMGKLMSQDPNDEPADSTIRKMLLERQRLEKAGVYRKARVLASVSNDEQAYVIPDGWVWARLGQIGDWGAGATPSRSNAKYYGGSVPWFKSGELTSEFIEDSEEHVTEVALNECSLRQNLAGDVLLAMYGATIGKTSILSKPATTNQAVCACTPYNGMFNQYLLLLLKALKPNFVGQGAGGAQPNISREKIVATVFALPPTNEQHRIVAKVDELMALCDLLKSQLAESRQQVGCLADTLIQTSLKAA